jgi:glycosyltransferase involved in cell wall biosynthesis
MSTRTDRPILLGYLPRSASNPFQALLYSRCREHGLAPVGMRRVDELAELTALQRAGHETLLHLHWLHPVTAGAASEAKARAASEAFIERLDDHRAAGGRLVWTVHNILPHDTRFEATEAWLSGEVAARCDVVHIMAAGTPNHVAPYFRLPAERLLVVPHPSYLGAYPDHVSRLDARHELGLLPDEFVVAVVGAIKAYKGLAGLLDAWQTLPAEWPRRLVVAGAPGHESGVEALIARASLDPTILVDARRIPTEEMQLFLRSADVAVLPYLRALNSGALALALTFGVPVIVPAGGGLEEVVDADFGRAVPISSTDRLREALLDAPRWVSPESRRAARARAEALAPSIVAEEFAVAMRERLGLDRLVSPTS